MPDLTGDVPAGRDNVPTGRLVSADGTAGQIRAVPADSPIITEIAIFDAKKVDIMK
jgi:hypothetical protein